MLFSKKKKIDLEIFFFPEKIKEICFMKYFGSTPFYCAPEIKKTEEFNLTPKADIFSFGMFILIFILFFFFSLNSFHLEFYMSLQKNKKLLLSNRNKAEILIFISLFERTTLSFLIIIKGQEIRILINLFLFVLVNRKVKGQLQRKLYYS